MPTSTNTPELPLLAAGMDIAEELRVLTDLYPGRLVFSTSLGQEDQVITHLIAQLQLPVSIFTLDTGRLFPQTLDLLARTESRYKLRIQLYYPERAAVESWVAQHGINGFYESVAQRKSCCYVRKIEPLQRALAGHSVWITGLRAEQSPNRAAMEKIEWDSTYQIIKYNPLIHWTYEQLLAYIEAHRIPCNPLHQQGFVSIGCAPCTRAIQPGEDARAGRWWWEDSKKECGLHSK